MYNVHRGCRERLRYDIMLNYNNSITLYYYSLYERSHPKTIFQPLLFYLRPEIIYLAYLESSCEFLNNNVTVSIR